MWKHAVIGVVGLVGLSSGLAHGSEVPTTVDAVAASLEDAGYTEVAVTLRVFGGYVLQARKGDAFVMVALGADGVTLDHAEVFRDSDGDGVFGSDEALGPDETQPLRLMVTTALSAPDPDPDGPDGGTGDVRGGVVEIAGFAQRPESLFAGASLRASAREVLGSGHVVSTVEREETIEDTRGGQRRAVQTLQSQSMSGFEIRDQIATVMQPGGAPGEFQPLTFAGGFADADAIRADALSQTPDAESLRNSITGAAPDAEALRTRILGSIPSADAIRGAIVPPAPQP